ncbi:hypothetical protein [Ornithinimicrobium kibberense]|uniref:hypothetical protein n=1 Tax=Ornithinimicrobium kibberense TaxID=282060 RepID=UPI003606553E
MDSPPGTTRPSRPSSSPGRRTGRTRAPASSRARMCSRTSPWTARIPTSGPSAGSAACGPALTSRARRAGAAAGCRRR